MPRVSAAFRRLAARVPPRIGRHIPRRPLFMDPQRSSLRIRDLRKIQFGTMRYEYGGIRCAKSPFDLALYMMLLGRERPRTIVEIGSLDGGSAVWFAAQSRALSIDAHVYSIDIDMVRTVVDPDVTFLEGDIHDLESSGISTILDDCPRPLLVVEDGPHTYEGCTAAMEFFHPHMRAGEFLVIEDGNLHDLRYFAYRNGPNRAIADFLERHPGAYRTASEYCHYYGHNVTWNANGYLQKLPTTGIPGASPE